jgi:hypothetical protein
METLSLIVAIMLRAFYKKVGMLPFSGEKTEAKQLALFPDDREELPAMDCETIRVQLDKPYRCLDLLLKHRDELFEFLKGQWGNLFGAKYDVLLYDLTSTYFESDPPPAGSGSKKRFGYSRDKRSDCIQVVVALVLTPEGFPVAYEVYPGNTRDTATREGFLDRIEKQLLEQRWIQARENVSVKIPQQESEFYVYVESHDRVAKERSMRRRTTDGRHIVMSRYTQQEKDVSLLLAQPGLSLPDQPPPKVYASGQTRL